MEDSRHTFRKCSRLFLTPSLVPLLYQRSLKFACALTETYDHRGICMENTQYEKHNNIKNGLPPHTWGIPRFTKCCSRRARITPTCVGNTRIDSLHNALERDHQYIVRVAVSTMIKGSPPLAWGIPSSTASNWPALRITPTCVGNTRWCTIPGSSAWDHPHLRGEYIVMLVLSAWPTGSPPLAWGIHDYRDDGGNKMRITPTCVGNTHPVPLFIQFHEDHPHLRGEYQHRVHARC
ncbi:hypothetical protein HMPREF9264_0722 [Lactobacillus delbrueckii subsp. bulgaricus PB2003/044-T3-4]|nr:hypothetical protein HMPREF9264_0722 [Lactobacillus delbrueckii subsp. bulgaricus PB2003/044-T3-4]